MMVGLTTNCLNYCGVLQTMAAAKEAETVKTRDENVVRKVPTNSAGCSCTTQPADVDAWYRIKNVFVKSPCGDVPTRADLTMASWNIFAPLARLAKNCEASKYTSVDFKCGRCSSSKVHARSDSKDWLPHGRLPVNATITFFIP
jgi:hypothetical protein